MNDILNEKYLGLAISLSAVLAFGATAPVKADTLFPPAHSSAVFQESKTPSDVKFQGPYYRSQNDAIYELTIANGDVKLAYISGGIAPYYRAAN